MYKSYSYHITHTYVTYFYMTLYDFIWLGLSCHCHTVTWITPNNKIVGSDFCLLNVTMQHPSLCSFLSSWIEGLQDTNKTQNIFTNRRAHQYLIVPRNAYPSYNDHVITYHLFIMPSMQRWLTFRLCFGNFGRLQKKHAQNLFVTRQHNWEVPKASRAFDIRPRPILLWPRERLCWRIEQGLASGEKSSAAILPIWNFSCA